MDEDQEKEAFKFLWDYKRAMKTNCMQVNHVKEKEEEEDPCKHEEQVEVDGFDVCTSCGLALMTVFKAEVDWYKRCVTPKVYSSPDRLRAVNKHLARFITKADLRIPMHPLQERLQAMKKQSRYKSLNYAIALTCLVEPHDIESLEKLRTFLPKSHLAWARSSKIFPRPLPPSFIRCWLNHLMKSTKPLTATQEKAFHERLARLQPDDMKLMLRLIRSYGCPPDREVCTYPDDLRCALYRFSRAATTL